MATINAHPQASGEAVPKRGLVLGALREGLDQEIGTGRAAVVKVPTSRNPPAGTVGVLSFGLGAFRRISGKEKRGCHETIGARVVIHLGGCDCDGSAGARFTGFRTNPRRHSSRRRWCESSSDSRGKWGSPRNYVRHRRLLFLPASGA